MGHTALFPEVIRGFEELPQGDAPVHMLNLLRYRERADYGDRGGVTPCSGQEAYGRYVGLVTPMIGAFGASVVSMGHGQATLIGAPGEHWDDLLLVNYPTRAAFLGLMRSKDYQAVMFHRQAALADSRLIAFTPGVASFERAQASG